MQLDTSAIAPPRATGDLPRVFVSYSRKDKASVVRILRDLETERRFDVYIDTRDILPTEDWRKRLGELIDGADTVIFCLSPNSASSDICAWEAKYAAEKNKRIVPIVLRELDSRAPPEIERL